jgi:hypothetical protein
MSHPVRLVDSKTGRPISIDKIGYAIATIDYVHHEIHEGNHFMFSYVDADFDIADTLALLLTVKDKPIHLNYDCIASKDITMTLYEGVTHTALADVGTTINNNRTSPKPNTMRVTTRNSDGSDGTAIWTTYFGIGANPANVVSTPSRSDVELILRPNTKYQLVIATGTDSGYLTLHLYWYAEEEHNK